MNDFFRKIKVCHYNIGHLSGPVYKVRKHYPHEITYISLKEFFPSIIKKIIPAYIKDIVNYKKQSMQKKYRKDFSDKKSSLERAEILCEYINKNDFDIITLNEIDSSWPFNVFEYIKKNSNLTNGVFGSCYNFDHIMNNGNAIISKHKIIDVKEEYLDYKNSHFYDYFNYGRRAVIADIELGSIKQKIICTHLVPTSGKRKKYQVNTLSDVIKNLLKENSGFILCADLNSTLKFENKYFWGDDDKYTGYTIKRLENLVNKKQLPEWFLDMFDNEKKFDIGTYPVIVNKNGKENLKRPANRFLDYVLPIGFNAPKISNLYIDKTILISDHYPIVAEIEISPQPSHPK